MFREFGRPTWPRSSVSIALAALVALVALAGCADDKGSEENDDTFEGIEGLEATDDTGIILGVVLDTAVVPIAGVEVSLPELDRNTTTNEHGAFGFDALDPGIHQLIASKPGYETIRASAEVEAGVESPSPVKISLPASPSTQPFVSPIYMQGFIACSFTMALVSFAACGLPVIDETLNNEFILYHNFERKADWVQSEMVWQSTQTLGSSMSISWTDPSSGTQVGINSSAGPSPQTVTFDNSTFEEMELVGKDLWLRVFSTQAEGTDQVDEETWNSPYRDTLYPTYNGTVPDAVKDPVNDTLNSCHPYVGCTLSPLREDCVGWAVLFDACLGVGGVGATVQQEYEIFTHVFYNFQPDDGWTYVADGEHPLPP